MFAGFGVSDFASGFNFVRMSGARKTDWVEVVVDKADFLSVIRVIREMFPGGVPDIRLTVENREVRFEFPNGGSVLKCTSKHVIVAHVPGKTVRRIVSAHRTEKLPAGEMALVFRPKLQVIATPRAGGPASIAVVKDKKSIQEAAPE